MSYLLKNNRRNYSGWKPVLIVAIFLFVSGVFYIFFPKQISEAVYSIAKPVWSIKDTIYQQSSVLFGTALANKEKLYKENLNLQIELDEARTNLQSLEFYKKENEDLKNLLGRSNNEARLLATVLSKPNRSVYDTLVIDIGAKNSVKKGDYVVSDNFIIGEVDEVYENYSKVKLSSTYGQKTNVRVGNVNVDSVAEGRGGGNYFVRLPKDLHVEIGDLIKSIGLGPKFYGKVLSIEKTETSAFQFLLFKLPVNIYTLDKVEIILK